MKTQRQAWGNPGLEWSTVVDTDQGSSNFVTTQAHNGVLDWYLVSQAFNAGSEFVLLGSQVGNVNSGFTFHNCFLEYDGRLRWEADIYETDDTSLNLAHYWGTSGQSCPRRTIFEDPDDANKAYYVPFLTGTSKASWKGGSGVPMVLHVDVSGTAPTIDDQALLDYDSTAGNGTSCVMPNGDIVVVDGNVLFIFDKSASPAYEGGTKVTFNNMDGIWHVTNYGDDIVVTGYSNDGTYEMATVALLDSDYATINASRRWNTNTNTYCYGLITKPSLDGNYFYVMTLGDDFSTGGNNSGTNYPGITKLDTSLNVVWCYHSNYEVDGDTNTFFIDARGSWMPSIALHPYEDIIYLMVPDVYWYYTWSYAESNGGGYLLKIDGSDGSLLWEKKLDAPGDAKIHSPQIDSNTRGLFFCGFYDDGDGYVDKVCAAKLYPWTVDGASENGPYHVWDFADEQQWTTDWTREDNLGPFQEETPGTFTVSTATPDSSNEDEASVRQAFTEIVTNVLF